MKTLSASAYVYACASAMEAKNQGRDALALDRLRELAVSLGVDPDNFDWSNLLKVVEVFGHKSLLMGFLEATLFVYGGDTCPEIDEKTVYDFAPATLSKITAIIAAFCEAFPGLVDCPSEHLTRSRNSESASEVLGYDLAMSVFGTGCGFAAHKCWGEYDQPLIDWVCSHRWEPYVFVCEQDGKVYAE